MADGITSTMAMTDEVMGVANRAEPTIRDPDIKSVMQKWSMWG